MAEGLESMETFIGHNITNLMMTSKLLKCLHFCVTYKYISKNLNIMEKGQYFLSLISESETHILYRLITHRVKYFKTLFLEILMIMAYKL